MDTETRKSILYTVMCVYSKQSHNSYLVVTNNCIREKEHARRHRNSAHNAHIVTICVCVHEREREKRERE